MTRGRTLVAGVGNIFLSDDGFGVEVANRLATRSLPEDVVVADFGIRGVHLAYELLDGYDTLILVDALPLDEAPGTLAVFRPESDRDARGVVDAHDLDPAGVLAALRELGGRLDSCLIVGCQPATLEEGIGLSAPVEGAVTFAVERVLQLLATEEATP